MTRRRWLLICHAFNMDGVASSLTVTDKIPHLVAAGIDPIVISAPTGRKDTQVEHRQVFSPLPSGLRYEMRHYFKYHGGRSGLRAVLSALLLPFYLVEKLLLPFGSWWSWFVAAYREGRKAIRERKPELIYSSGGANSAHFAAYLLARRTGLPWLAEVHDPMIHADWKKGPFQYRWAAYVEKLICRHASVAIWFTPTALARATQRHPELGERGHVMYPGANPPDPPKLPYRKGERFVLAHFGSLAPNRNLAVTLAAIDLVIERDPRWRDVLRLHTYGGGWDEVSKAARAKMRNPQVIEDFGRLEYDAATGLSGRQRVRQRMDAADALLLLHNTDAFSDEYFPSKVYEYLWARRPILGLIASPDLEQFLKRLGYPVARGDDPRAIADQLEALLQRWQRGDLADAVGGSAYSTQNAVTELIAWADRCIR